MSAVDETVEPLLFVGPLCDDHRARVLSGEDYELQGSEQSASGTTTPYVLMGESLRALNQYVLLASPDTIENGNEAHGDRIPLRVHLRGGADESDLTLLIKREMQADVASFFQYLGNRRFGQSQESDSE